MKIQILINRGGQQHGPYTVEQVQAYLTAGQLLVTDNAWAQGQPAWQPLSALLAQLIPPSLLTTDSSTTAEICPKCHSTLVSGQVICKSCGLNLQTRQATTVIQVPPHMQKPAAGS